MGLASSTIKVWNLSIAAGLFRVDMGYSTAYIKVGPRPDEILSSFLLTPYAESNLYCFFTAPLIVLFLITWAAPETTEPDLWRLLLVRLRI